MKFIKEKWPVIGGDIIKFVRHFFIYGSFLKSNNTIWVTLIQKVTNPLTIDDFRPISVVSHLYKIISKILSNKLKHVMPDIISEKQSGFIHARQIMDGRITANKSIYWLKKRNKKGSVFKLDFKKSL